MIHWLSETKRRELQRDPEASIQSLIGRITQLDGEELFSLAAAYYLIQDQEKSKKFCRLALQKNFCHVPSLYGLALIFFGEGKELEAKRFFSKALHFDSDAASSVLYLQQQLRSILGLTDANQLGLWCLEQLNESNKGDRSCQFELGKILFERSEFEQAVPVLKPLMGMSEYSFEVTQYLSYIYERLYSGDQLIEKTLELGELVSERSDLFFNLAMICQHDQGRLDMAVHFFYLAVRSDPKDPGLRFSLEQACLELIGQLGKPNDDLDYFHLMIAHLYHGSLAVAERYARTLRKRFQWSHPRSFQSLAPHRLWDNWLLKDEGVLGEALNQWFGDQPVENWKINKPKQPMDVTLDS